MDKFNIANVNCLTKSHYCPFAPLLWSKMLSKIDKSSIANVNCTCTVPLKVRGRRPAASEPDRLLLLHGRGLGRQVRPLPTPRLQGVQWTLPECRWEERATFVLWKSFHNVVFTIVFYKKSSIFKMQFIDSLRKGLLTQSWWNTLLGFFPNWDFSRDCHYV
jgi:hypothetical protein